MPFGGELENGIQARRFEPAAIPLRGLVPTGARARPEGSAMPGSNGCFRRAGADDFADHPTILLSKRTSAR
jgi:hypothetical protein